MKRIAIVTMVLVACTTFVETAEASPRTLIYQAANSYRDAVREFERQVLRVPYIHRHDERLVDDLEDQTSRLRSAARHPEIASRFIPEWNKTLSLQAQVETAIFGPGCYPRNPVLEQHWQQVLYRFAVMAEQVSCFTTNPRHNASGYASAVLDARSDHSFSIRACSPRFRTGILGRPRPRRLERPRARLLSSGRPRADFGAPRSSSRSSECWYFDRRCVNRYFAHTSFDTKPSKSGNQDDVNSRSLRVATFARQYSPVASDCTSASDCASAACFEAAHARFQITDSAAHPNAQREFHFGRR